MVLRVLLGCSGNKMHAGAWWALAL